jgi:hypothetical protein
MRLLRKGDPWARRWAYPPVRALKAVMERAVKAVMERGRAQGALPRDTPVREALPQVHH